MKYSVVVPIYNDAYLADALCLELEKVMRARLGIDSLEGCFELIFVNDGGCDPWATELMPLLKSYDFVKIIELSRNFGQHAAIACGMREARGDIVLRMNVDMQDPPHEIPKLLDAIERDGCDIAIGQYSARRSPFLNRVTAWLYFRLFGVLTGFDVPQRTSPLRAMNRKFVDAYNALTEKSRFPQGLDQWLGFRHQYIEIEHRARIDNRSSYNLWKRAQLALNGILYFSDRPLKLIVALGFCVALAGILLAGYIVVRKLFGADYVAGYVSLLALGLSAFGVQLGCTGLVGLYVAKIFKEVQNRPLYIIRGVYTR